MDDLSGICHLCGQRTYIDIMKIEGSKEGYVIKGRSICNSCGQFFDLQKNIHVILKGLECPSCRQNAFDIDYGIIEQIEEGFKFSALLTCKTRTCNWKNDIISGVQSIRSAFANIDSIEVSLQNGAFKINMKN